MKQQIHPRDVFTQRDIFMLKIPNFRYKTPYNYVKYNLRQVVFTDCRAFSIQSESNNEEVINDNDALFLHHINSNLIDEDENQAHLPIPVYSYIKPTTGVQFINHIMLSMGRFTSEIDLRR